LNQAHARYVLIGGFAMIAHGASRFASPATLIKTKNTYRPQDAIDRAFLEALLRGR
jgi:hypothetical protein